jgi:hypothetical protein
MTSAALLPETFLSPITFGITGHRDILPEDIIRAKESIQLVIKSFRKRYPKTPLIIISPLAEGADCIAAETFLAEDNNCFLHTVYPFPLEEYKKTISIDWHEKFDSLTSHERLINQITLNSELTNLSEDQRNQGYKEVGEFVAINSYVLFALMNNEPAQKKGGTAEIVEFRKRGCIDLLEVSDSNIRCAEEGLLYEIRVRRSYEKELSAPTEMDDAYFITPIVNGKNRSEEARIELGLSNERPKTKAIEKIKSYIQPGDQATTVADEIELLNCRSLELINTFAESMKSGNATPERTWATEALYKIYEHKNKIATSSGNIYTQHLRGTCDKLASDYQAKYKRCLNWVFILSVLIGLLHGFEGVLERLSWFEENPFAKYVFAGMALSVWYVAKKNGYKDIYESYRALSEALRIQEYWHKANIRKVPADFFLSTQMGDNSWVRRALRTAWFMDLGEKNGEINSQERNIENIATLDTSWVKDQIKYLSKKIDDFENKLKKFDQLNLALGVTAGGFFILGREFIFNRIEGFPLPLELINAISGCAIIFLALSKGYCKMNAFEVLIKRYKSSLHVYVQSEKIHNEIINLDNEIALKNMIDKTERLQGLYLTLGQSVLDEVADWYIVNSREEFKNPVGD